MILNSPSVRRAQMELLDFQSKAGAKEPSKSKHTFPTTNFSAKDYSKKERDAGRHRKKPSKKKTYRKAHRVASDVDVNAVPNPAPESEPTRTFAPVRPTTGIYTGVLPVNAPAPVSSATASTSGFSPLPPLAAFATTVSTSASLTYSTSSTISAPISSPTTLHTTAASQPPPHLSVVVIVLIAVGSAFLLVLAFVVVRLCNRPRKHLPTPSLPILQDPFQDDEKRADPDEESLFGGKERASVRSGNNNVLLDWTQYPHTSMIQKSQPTVNVQAAPPSHVQRRKSRDVAQGSAYLFKGIGSTQGNLTAPATNRVSMHSVSVYPGSPVSTAGHDVGIAVGGSPLTADNNPVLQRSNSKATRRMSQSARSVRQSVISTYGTSDLYGIGSPIPATPKAAATPANAGRARVKAPYAPGILRASAIGPAPVPARGEQHNPFEETQYVLPPLSPMAKSDDRRERDTKALTSALGLASPAPVPYSPQMTLYPDDSITLAGDRRQSRGQLLSPTVDDSARLGKFMMGDFQSMASLPSTRAVPAAGPSNIPRMPKPVLRKRVEEKPPRVPSPPPMPSLAQMAMAHTNPQDFEDYRSPTYSIYGLYESDRKSRMPGEGGY